MAARGQIENPAVQHVGKPRDWMPVCVFPFFDDTKGPVNGIRCKTGLNFFIIKNIYTVIKIDEFKFADIPVNHQRCGG